MKNNDANEKTQLRCLKCGEPYSGKVLRPFSGFNKFKCRKCSHVNLYPIKRGVFNLYVVFCVFGILASGFPGLFFVYIFIKNKFIWKKLAKDQQELFRQWDRFIPSRWLY